MRKVLVAVFVVGIAIFTLQRTSSAQQPAQNPQPQNLSIQATAVAELRTWDAFVTAESRSGDLRLRSVVRDPLLPAREVERFDQFHNGVRIWGADVVRDSERGVPQSIFGDLASPDLQLSTDPALSVDDARAALLRLGGADALLLVQPEIVISRLDSGEYRLAYEAAVSGDSDVSRVFIDAHSGSELMRYSEIQAQQTAVGTGRGVLGDTKKLSVLQQGGAFVADDRLRPPVLRTFDMKGSFGHFIAVATGSALFASDLALDSDNNWTDASAVDAHAHVGWTYDYYYKRFGRRGLDDRDRAITTLINPLTPEAALSAPDNVIEQFVRNASWCGPCGPGGAGIMFFGNGVPSGIFFRDTGQNVTPLAGSLDITAHELTHGVTDSSSRLIYRNESGALNEAFSDIMGTSVEFFYQTPGAGPGLADYLIGEDSFRAFATGSVNGIRSMANPALYGQPDHYSRYRGLPDTPAGDNGGVHINSGIPNQAFYLSIEGGANRTSGVAVQGVGSANREQIEKVFYRAFTLLLPASATFSTARIATIQSALDLYGSGSSVERAVTQAWDAVGVTNTSSNTPVITRLSTFTGTLPVGGATAFYYYIVNMPATGRYQAVLNWNDPSVDLDIMIGPPGCTSYSCMLTRAESATRRPETVCLSVRTGEQYWVLMQNFGPRPTSFELVQTIDPSPTGACVPPGPTAMPPSETSGNKRSSDVGARAYQLNAISP